MSALKALLVATVSTAIALPTPALAAPAPAAAAPVDWATTFTPTSVSAHLGDNKPNVIIIAPNAESRAAAAAFRSALNASKRAGVVIDGQALGALDSLDDRAILDRAKVLPVQQVIVVRVFEAGPGEPPSFIAMGYAVSGDVAVALSGTGGVPLTSDAPPMPEVEVASDEPVGSVEVATQEPEAPEVDDQARLAAEKEYASERLGGTWGDLRRGDPGVAISRTEFYEILGRPELTAQYHQRKKTRLAVGLGAGIVGTGLFAVGLTYMILNGTATRTGPDYGADDPLLLGDPRVRYPIGAPLAGAMLGVGGALLIGMGVFLGVYRAHPVKASEAGGLIDEHNRGLRQRLQLAPMVGRHNGLALIGRF